MIPCIAGWAGPTPRCRFCGPPPVPLPSPSMNSWRVVSAIVLARRADQRLAPGDRVVLPERVAHELLVHEEPPGIGMPLEAHAEHAPHLTLEPVRDRPQRNRGRHRRVVLVQAHLQPQTVVVGERVEVIDDLVAWPLLA